MNLVHCYTAEHAVCENELPVLEAQRLDSVSDVLKHNSNKSTTGGMIPGSFTPTILPAIDNVLLAPISSTAHTLGQSNLDFGRLASLTIIPTARDRHDFCISCVLENTSIVAKILFYLNSCEFLMTNAATYSSLVSRTFTFLLFKKLMKKEVVFLLIENFKSDTITMKISCSLLQVLLR